MQRWKKRTKNKYVYLLFNVQSGFVIWSSWLTDLFRLISWSLFLHIPSLAWFALHLSIASLWLGGLFGPTTSFLFAFNPFSSWVQFKLTHICFHILWPFYLFFVFSWFPMETWKYSKTHTHTQNFSPSWLMLWVTHFFQYILAYFTQFSFGWVY